MIFDLLLKLISSFPMSSGSLIWDFALQKWRITKVTKQYLFIEMFAIELVYFAQDIGFLIKVVDSTLICYKQARAFSLTSNNHRQPVNIFFYI